MLRIGFIADCPGDTITPINVASSLISSDRLGSYELEEIAEHLLAYVKRIKREEGVT